MLAGGALLAVRTLRRRIGPAAPLWVAVFVFGSVAFAYVFWVHADLFLAAATAAGFAVVYGGGGTRHPFPRWALAGLLLAIPGAYPPFYPPLLAPPPLAGPPAPPPQRPP